jgi:predicted dehydrogenase
VSRRQTALDEQKRHNMKGPSQAVRLVVVGAGLIGQRHIQRVLASEDAELVAIVDPSENARDIAGQAKATWYADLNAMLTAEQPDGIVIATPNQMHVEHGLACIAAGVPALIEKPIAHDLEGAIRLVDASENAGVPLLVGHHRRHNPLVQRAREAITSGSLGRVISVHGACWFYKSDEYFETQWRREVGAGPVFLNLIHDIDLLRYLCGEVISVQAMQSNARRDYVVEDTAVVLLRFDGEALGSINLSDTIVAPWSWELTSGENPAYTHTQEACYWIGGTLGSLALPQLELWRHETRPDWWSPIHSTHLSAETGDPLALQIANFCDVIRGRAPPVVSGREGLRTLAVIAAIKEAATTGSTVEVSEILARQLQRRERP